MSDRYSLEPLTEATGLSVAAVLRRCGAAGGQWARYREEGVREATAERYAERLGLHPFEVWPEMLDRRIAAMERTCADPTCSETFTKTHHSQKYCSPQCRLRTNSRDHNRKRYQTNAEYREAKKEASRQATRELWENGSEAWKRRQRDRKREWVARTRGAA